MISPPEWFMALPVEGRAALAGSGAWILSGACIWLTRQLLGVADLSRRVRKLEEKAGKP